MLESKRSGEHRASTGVCPQDGAMGSARAQWGHGVWLVPHPTARGKKEGTSRTRRYSSRLERQGVKVHSLTELKYYFRTQLSKDVLFYRFFYISNLIAIQNECIPLSYISAARIGKTGIEPNW